MYNLIKALFKLIFSLVFRWEIVGEENIPRHGGAIIAANHISLWDPPLLGTAIKRNIHFMAKEELFTNPLFRALIVTLKAFPVKRGAADRNAIRKAIALLDSGELVGLFPEGTRSKTGKLGQPEPGIGMIALKAGAPIIPTAIIGTNRFNKCAFPKFKVIFGKPIFVNKEKADKEAMGNISNKIMSEISSLLEQE